MQWVAVIERNALAGEKGATKEALWFGAPAYREKDADGFDAAVFVCALDAAGGTAAVVVGKERLIIGFPRGYG